MVAEASTLDAEMHLVSRGVGLSITSEAVGVWWPQDTGLVAGLAAVANEVRAGIADA